MLHDGSPPHWQAARAARQSFLSARPVRLRRRIQGPRELINLLLRRFLRDSVPLLQLSGELVALASDLLKIIVGQLAPLLLQLPRALLPLAFHLFQFIGVLLLSCTFA